MIDYIINILKGIFKKENKDYVLEEKSVERKPKEIKVGKKKILPPLMLTKILF